jgi:hypothetical protein
MITLLTSLPKSGKTTLLAILLAKLRAGGELAGEPVRAAKAVVLSEEARSLWRQRHRKLGFGAVYFVCRPFAGKPRPSGWEALLAQVTQLHREHGLDLVVVDTLQTLLPSHAEADASRMLQSLLPLQQLTTAGLSVLLLHHSHKGKPLPGQAARGTSALPAFVDISLEMYCPHPNDPDDRRRSLLGFSRCEETRRQVMVELNAAGTDYGVCSDVPADDFLEHWDALRLVLEEATDKLDRRALREDWPPDFPRPSDATLWRWLRRAVALSLVCQEGTGRRHDPFLYWLPSQETKWKADPLRAFLYRASEEHRQHRREAASILTGAIEATPAPAAVAPAPADPPASAAAPLPPPAAAEPPALVGPSRPQPYISPEEAKQLALVYRMSGCEPPPAVFAALPGASKR